MLRASIEVITLSAVAAIGALIYLHVTREDAEQETATPAALRAPALASQGSAVAAAPVNGVVNTQAALGVSANDPDATAAQPAAPPTIDQLIKDTQSSDAQKRAAAIAALADAPKAKAVPALERVLESGEPQVDRQIALRSLHQLALKDGDPDSTVRDAMRRAMYHSDDDEVTQSAQSLLDDIESDLASRQPDSTPP
jgi:HEAT repeat protein